jgi:hypothetical protein
MGLLADKYLKGGDMQASRPHSFHVFDDVFGEFGVEDSRVEALLRRAS